MSSIGEVMTAAIDLPLEARAKLAKELLLSLEVGQDDDGVEAAWSEEVQTRLNRLDEGRSEAKEWREAMTDLRSRLARRR